MEDESQDSTEAISGEYIGYDINTFAQSVLERLQNDKTFSKQEQAILVQGLQQQIQALAMRGIQYITLE